jgi:uncharacterized protein YoxC
MTPLLLQVNLLFSGVLFLCVLVMVVMLVKQQQKINMLLQENKQAQRRYNDQIKVIQSGAIGLGKQLQALKNQLRDDTAKASVPKAKSTATPMPKTASKIESKTVGPKEPIVSKRSAQAAEDAYGKAERLAAKGLDCETISSRTGLSLGEVQLLTMITQANVTNAA